MLSSLVKVCGLPSPGMPMPFCCGRRTRKSTAAMASTTVATIPKPQPASSNGQERRLRRGRGLGGAGRLRTVLGGTA